eukprot:UN00182
MITMKIIMIIVMIILQNNDNESPADYDLDNDFSVALAASTIKGCNVVNKTPAYNQPNGYTCGATSLRMVMESHGVAKTINQICNVMGCPTSGVGESTLVSAAKNLVSPKHVLNMVGINLKLQLLLVKLLLHIFVYKLVVHRVIVLLVLQLIKKQLVDIMFKFMD